MTDNTGICERFSGSTDSEIIRKTLEEIKQHRLADSFLDGHRQAQILEQLLVDVPGFERYQERIRKDEEKDNKPLSEEVLGEPQWFSPATTSPVILEFSSLLAAKDKMNELDEMELRHKEEVIEDGKIKVILNDGCRTAFAFYKTMCDYKNREKGGCRFCYLSKANRLFKNVTTELQLRALDRALDRARELKKNIVFEILPDGSFLNKDEVPMETQDGMMQRLAKEKKIHRVAIETRPEYCRSEDVKRNLSHLRPDQQLEIYFGLESTDQFVRDAIHKKGYSFEDFKEAARGLAVELSPEELKRLKISTYHIIKPAYLTEQESMQSAIEMAREIKQFSQEVGIDMEVKYEPAVVSQGTLQGYLYQETDEYNGERRYKPLNYFTVAELIARLHQMGLSDLAKFGQRDDIDQYTTVAMIPQLDNENMFSLFDFMVYNAVQRFNITKDVRGFLIDMKIAIEHSPEFKIWEKEFCGENGKSSLSDLLSKTLVDNPLTQQEEVRVDYQKNIWKVADIIEYHKPLSDHLRKNGQKNIQGTQTEDDIKTIVQGLFEGQGVKFYMVKNINFVDIGGSNTPRLDMIDINQDFNGCSEQASFQIEVVVLNEEEVPQSVWVKIPLKYQELPEKPDFIYKD